MLLADLDHFKAINDTYGHLAGDAVLREAADRMRLSLRGYDTVGRYGGEEFLVLLPGCGPDETLRLAERLREVVAGSPVRFGGRAIPLTVSLGAAVCRAPSETSASATIKVADEALYRAKRGGRNRVEFGRKGQQACAGTPHLKCVSAGSGN